MSSSTEKTEVTAPAAAPAPAPTENNLGDAAGPAADNTKKKHRVDDRDKKSGGGHGEGLHDLKVKSEYILSARAESLGPIKAVAEETGGGDEIRDYLDARYVGPAEAAWRLFEFPMHGKSHTIERLPVHQEGEQQCAFEADS